MNGYPTDYKKVNSIIGIINYSIMPIDKIEYKNE